MNYILFIESLILGILFKSYDEIIDNNLKVNKQYIFILQSSIILLSFYLYLQDALFMLFCIIVYYCGFIFDYILFNYKAIDATQLAMNDSFWHFYAILLIPIFIFNYKNIIAYNFNNIKNVTIILNFCCGFIMFLLEGYFFSEENSSAKILFRIFFIIYFIGLMCGLLYFNSYFYIAVPLIYLLWIGYLLASIIFKQYIIPNSSINISDTVAYIWKKLKSKKLQKKLKEKKEKKEKKENK